MPDQWKSIGLYEHSAKHQAGTYGNVVLSTAGVYVLRVGGSMMSCPQGWAAKIHKDEGDEAEFIVRACNAHDELVGLMKKGVKLRMLDESAQNEIVNWPQYWADVKQALRRAKGED